MLKFNSKKKYSIVGFEENEKGCMEVVPTCWLISSFEVWWPSHMKSISHVGKLISDCVMPNESLWEKLPVRVLENSNTLLGANEKAEQLLYTSNIESGDESNEFDNGPLKKRQRKPTKYFNIESPDCENIDMSPSFKKAIPISKIIPKPKKPKSDSIIKNTNSNILEDPESDEEYIPLPLPINTIDDLCKSVFAFQGKCLRLISSMQYEIKQVNQRLNSIEQRIITIELSSSGTTRLSAAGQTTIPIIRWEIPIETDDDLLATEHLLSDKDKMNSLILRLVLVGGEDFKKMTSNVMTTLLSKEVSLQYSMQGRKNKKSFISLLLYKCVIAAVQHKFKQCTDKEIRDRMSCFLAQAADRNGGRKTRVSKVQTVDEDRKSSDNEHIDTDLIIE